MRTGRLLPIATLITNKDLHSDFFKLLRRRQSMTMASELGRDLVPPQVLATAVLSALLEPCDDIGATPTTTPSTTKASRTSPFNGDVGDAWRCRRALPVSRPGERYA